MAATPTSGADLDDGQSIADQMPEDQRGTQEAFKPPMRITEQAERAAVLSQQSWKRA